MKQGNKRIYVLSLNQLTVLAWMRLGKQGGKGETRLSVIEEVERTESRLLSRFPDINSPLQVKRPDDDLLESTTSDSLSFIAVKKRFPTGQYKVLRQLN